MQLLKSEDPRDSLMKASRYELCQLAHAHGISDVCYEKDMTLEEIVSTLRKNGINEIKIPDRPLGIYKPVLLGADGPPIEPKQVFVEAVKEVTKSVPEMNMTELRKECKRRGIKMIRTDNLETLRMKLGQNAA